MNPIPGVKKRVESGWYLRGANRDVSGSPSGSKIGLGAGRAGRVDLAALLGIGKVFGQESTVVK